MPSPHQPQNYLHHHSENRLLESFDDSDIVLFNPKKYIDKWNLLFVIFQAKRAEHSFQIIPVEKMGIQGVYELFWVYRLVHIIWRFLVGQEGADRLLNYLFRKIGAEESEQLIVVKPVSDVRFYLKYFNEIEKKAYLIDYYFAKGAERFEENMLAFVALVQKFV